ncbi:MAG: class I SAM-dependent methyltransferase [Thermoplasmata archaeon]
MQKGKYAADFGGGYGRLMDILLNNFDHVFLIDYSARNLLNAKKKFGSERVTYIASDIRKQILLNNSIDLGICIRVFHHYPSIPFIDSMTSSLVQHGKFIFNFNNVESPLFLLSLTRGFLKRDRNILNPLRKETQKIQVESGTRDIYFTPLASIVNSIPENMDIKEVEGFGLFHNSGFEKLSVKFDLAKITDFELSLGKIDFLSRLLPDIFIFLEKNGYEKIADIKKLTGIIIFSRCKGLLKYNGWNYKCESCGASFPTSDGIIDLI